MKKMSFSMVMTIAIFMFGYNTAQAAFSLEAGPIWNQEDANTKCAKVCTDAKATWNGQWWTTVENKMSVCTCERKAFTVEAGPIWNQADAEKKCPKTCASKDDAGWTGGWWTTVPNEMSVCECAQTGACNLEAGPIWNQGDAETKCPKTCDSQGGWNGQWWTTVENKMSVCTCKTCK